MKYWNKLTDLEETISNLGEFRNLFALLTNGIDTGIDQDVITSAIHTLSDMINDIDDNANSEFYALWKEISSSEEDSLSTDGAVEDDDGAWQRLEEALQNWKNISSGD